MTIRGKSKKLPIKQSIGVAICRRNTHDIPEILLVKKRYSYNFQSFVFGRHNNNNNILKKLFNGMTIDEKQLILSGKYELLWYKIFLRHPKIVNNHIDYSTTENIKNQHVYYKKRYHTRKEIDEIKGWKSDYKRKGDVYNTPNYTDYDQEETYYFSQKNKYDKLFIGGQSRLLSLMNQVTSISLVWEIPKGRKEKNETEISCAIRECREETLVSPDAYKLIHNKPISINHISNKMCYVYKYYVASYDNDYEIDKFDKNILKLTEVVDRRWVSLNMCELLEGSKGRLYRLCKRILNIYKKKCNKSWSFSIYKNIEQVSAF